jgi:hypothetical protein
MIKLCEISILSITSKFWYKLSIARSFKKSFSCGFAVCNLVWVDSALCGTVEGRLRAMPHSGESRLRAMPHSAELRLCAMRHIAESIFVVESNRITPRIRIIMQNRLSPWVREPRGTVWRKKNQRSKIPWDCPFNGMLYYQCCINRTNPTNTITFTKHLAYCTYSTVLYCTFLDYASTSRHSTEATSL